MTDAFDNRANNETSWLLIRFDSRVVFLATVDLGYLFEIDVAFLVSE